MAEVGEPVEMEQQSTAGKWILLVLAILFVAGAVYGYVTTQQRVEKLSSDLNASEAKVSELQKRMQSAEAQEETLGQKLGMTKKELAQRAAELQKQQRDAETRIERQEKEQIGQVSGEVAGVKSDVGGVKTDVASTRADLEATKSRLQGTIGDLGKQSGLIALTQSDLETLKHKGDRNYYEFTLLKGATCWVQDRIKYFRTTSCRSPHPPISPRKVISSRVASA